RTQAERWSLSKDADGLARMTRMLSTGVSIAVLGELVRARRKGEGWMYLTQLAKAIGETPGSVSHGLAKLAPLVEERREKGLRWFRVDLTDVSLELERPPTRRAAGALPARPRQP
ncbi:MAG TPA: helix-turn-helix domain-containing protein, partial [Candidatus Thermoplasmatota archaeon]|nr:helix-turn-helix domain-containing protein [Candidatus Thermoplasmatota archaeon]